MDVGGFFRGRLGLWRTTAIVWLLVSIFLLARSQVWHGLHNLDTDDAMRLVEVRDWLAGQGWFDTTQHRGWPAPGFSMHWSRIPDLAIGGLIALFGVALPRAGAEFAAMIVWPLVQLAATLPLVGLAARRMAGVRAVAPAMLLFALLGAASWQFHPGRIDHHGAQMFGIFLMLVGVLGLRRRPWAGVAAGLGGAFALAIGLEGLVFWLMLCGMAGLVLARDGVLARGAVAAFGLTVAVATPLLAFASNPTRYVMSQACDQIAMPVLALAVVGGLGLALAAALAGVVKSRLARLALVALAGALAAAAFVAAGPHCVRGPFADIDPRLGPIWLNHVVEAHTLPWLLARMNVFGVTSAVQAALGLAAVGLLLWLRPVLIRPVAIVSGVFLVAVALMFVQMRAITYTAGLASPLIAAAMVVVARKAGTPRVHWGAAMLAGLLVFTSLPLGSGLVTNLARKKTDEGAPKEAEGCFDPAAYKGLARLPAGLAVAPIDSGPFILMSSPLSVVSAPYHRNAAGVLAGHEFLAGKPDQSRALAERMGVRYVVMCRSGEILRMLRFEPDGLGARLDAGEVPGWLEPVGSSAGPVRVYRVR
ncbi:hypothetical protein [Phenylobacterium sp.]|uniref:hypothetical protein n=1 Tax=Phenylobacterium sp. TaxID=1871053 RepID=UPI0035B45C47